LTLAALKRLNSSGHRRTTAATHCTLQLASAAEVTVANDPNVLLLYWQSLPNPMVVVVCALQVAYFWTNGVTIFGE
jgi:hypothetical protein